MPPNDNFISRIARLDYVRFVTDNRRFLSFGVLMTLFASTGQTYYIAVFGGEIREEFGLSNGEYGLLYSLGGFGSAACLPWLGRLIDRVDLRYYATAVCLGAVGAAFFISAVHSVVLLGFAIFALRLCGQGLMGHTAMTSMGRYFDNFRGRAIAITTLGGTIGIAIYPIMGVTLIETVGWRQGWVIVAIVYAVVLIPIVLWSLKGIGARHEKYIVAREAKKQARSADNQKSDDGKVADLIRDVRFYLIFPCITAPSMILTGFIFHQVPLVEAKGWSHAAFASGFGGFAVGSFLTSMALGPVIDRIGATRILPYFQIPLILGLAVIAIFDHTAFSFIFLILIGMNLGGTITLLGSIWAEIYGTTYLGAVRSFSAALQVVASALGPWMMGWLLDIEFTIETIAVMSIAYAIAVSLLAAVPKFERH